MNGMRLRDFELGFALGTAQDFAFFDFVFIHVDFGRTFRAADHGSILRTDCSRSGGTRTVPATMQRIIYRDIEIQPPGGAGAVLNATAAQYEQVEYDFFKRVP